jgi:hypothetical protein
MALRNFRPQKIKHFCSNCEGETEFLCDLMYTGEPGSNYVMAYCSKCRLSNRFSAGEIPNEELLGVLLKGESLFVPCYVKDCPCEKREIVLPTLVQLSEGSDDEPDPEDVHPYELSKEDRETVRDDQRLRLKEAVTSKDT